MSQRTFTSSIYVKLGGQTSQNEDHNVKTVELDLDPVNKTITKEKSTSKEIYKVLPPEFIIKPRRQFVNEGQSAKFKASFEGSPTTVLNWSKDGTVLHSSRKYKIYKDEQEVHILEIGHVSPEDGGIYTCTIHNTGGTSTTTAELEVYSKPQKLSHKKAYVAPSVDSPLRDITVSPGDKNVILECKFSNAIDAIISWYKDGQPLYKSLGGKQTFDGHLSRLVLTSVADGHSGVYECAASNTGGEVRTCCRVSVMAPGTRSIPPKFIIPLSDLTLLPGDTLILESKITGYPRPTITWYKNQQEIKESRVLRTEFDGSTVRLIMENVDVSDSDSYKCIAENDVGIDQIKARVTIERETIKKSDTGSSSIQSAAPITQQNVDRLIPSVISPSSTNVLQNVSQNATVPTKHPSSPIKEENREPPIFLKELHDIEVKEGVPVELLVEVKGTPPVEIVWVHNNSEVSEDHPVYRTTCSDNIHQLVIPKSKVEDSGEFVCEAYNEFGEIDTFCLLTVNENRSEKFTRDEPLQCAETQVSPQRRKKISAEKPANHKSSGRDRPPDFILKPHSATVEEGKSAIFLCRPQGSPKPSVQWLKQGNVIENNEKFKITHGEDSILEIRDISAEDCGKYTCLLQNSAGSVSTEMELSFPGISPIHSSPSSSLQSNKRSTPQSPKRGGISRKIEMFDKSEEKSPASSKSVSTPSPASIKRSQIKFGSSSVGRPQNSRHKLKTDDKAEDFRDVLHRIKPSEKVSPVLKDKGRDSRSTNSDFRSLKNIRQREQSPVKVSDAIKKFSEGQKQSDDFVTAKSSRSVNLGKNSASPKHFSSSERSRSNVKQLANELSESPKNLRKHGNDNVKTESPNHFNKNDDINMEPDSRLTVKERQAVLHNDLSTIIDKKQTQILQEEISDGSKNSNAKTLPSPNSENRPKRNFLAEASQNNSVEIGAVFSQKFDPAKIKTTPEKQKRTSVIEKPVSGQNEFQKMLERKRNSLPTGPSPVKLLNTGSFRERGSGNHGNLVNTPSPITKTVVSRSNNINEVLDRLKDKPPIPENSSKNSDTPATVPKSGERINRSRNMGEPRRLSRESSPNFRNVLNQIEARTKNEQNSTPIPSRNENKIKKSISNDNNENSPVKLMTNSPTQGQSSIPKNNSLEFSQSNIHIAKKVNIVENHEDHSQFSDAMENFEQNVQEAKLEMQRIERVQKWDALSRLYAPSNEPSENFSVLSENETNNESVHNESNQNYVEYSKEVHIEQGNSDRLLDVPHTKKSTKVANFRSPNSNCVSVENSGVKSRYENMNGSNSESEVHENVNENTHENFSEGHAAIMSLKKHKLSEVEELFEDFSRIDRELESLKRNPKYGPLEKLDVDDADKQILSKISVLSANFSEDTTNSPADNIRGVVSKKQVKYSKKFDFEKSPASVEQLDFRHVLKRHVEPHHRQLPKFLVDLVDVKVSEGQPVTLECQVSGIPKPDVAWSMNNKRIKPSKFFRMTYENNTAKLVIAGAYPEDDGEYVCSATNSLGTSRCSCHLYVEECSSNPSNEVTDEEGPSDISSNQLSTLSSQCDTPVRKISYSSTETPPHPIEQQTFTAKQYERRTPSMPSVSTSLDESNFSDEEDELEMAKKQAPRIHEINPKNSVIERGQKLQLQVSFTAEPKPMVRWFRDSFEIISNQFYTISTTEHFSRLIIGQVDGGDSGKYNVVVENEVGSDSVETIVTVLDVPSPPSKPYATETTLFTVILSWARPDSDGGAPVKEYKVEICNAEEQHWETLSENCSSNSYCATNLPAHTPFFFRVSAKNKIGCSQASPLSDVIVTKDNHPSHRLSVDSDEEELPFSPRTVVPVTTETFDEHYEQIEEVGKGKFGNVYKCLHKREKETWAAKVIKCRKKEEKLNVKNEISIMNELTHPKLLMLRDAYETPKSMVLVMEYVGGGELFDRVADEDLELTERDCVHFMRQICEGVRYMHEKSIMHLDLKPENILCVRKDSNLIKIIDFGLARRYKAGESLKVMFGTPEFIAPEVVNYEQIGLPTDIWSLGVICYVLLSGLSPFMGDSDGETLSNVTQGEFDFDDEAFDEISNEARDFIEKCLHKNMRKRLTVSQCIEHKWLAQSERNSSKKLRQSLRNLKQFMARRKWQKMGTAIRAIGRMSVLQKQRGDSKSHDHSINSDSDIASQSDLSVGPVSRSPSHGRTDSKEDNQDTTDATETDEDVFNEENVNCVTNHCENCENNNKHFKIATNDKSAPAEIVKDMVDCEAVKGDIVRFDIGVEGQPMPTVSWHHGQHVLDEDSRHSFVQGRNGVCSLIIRDICEADEGEYTCKVINDFGEDSCSAELIVYGVNAF